jgi:hypothetical protein
MMLSSSGSFAEGKKDLQPQVVTEIIKVDYALEKIRPPNLVVTAVGKVNTGGWTNVQLVRVTYVMAPEDGIQDYILFAVPPSGPAPQVISEVKATNRWERYTEEAPWIKGIRVHGIDKGVLTKMLDSAGQSAGEKPSKDLRGRVTPEKSKTFDGYLFFKLGAICSKSEGPDYFLQLWDNRVIHVNKEKGTMLWKPDPRLHPLLSKKVRITGERTQNGIDYSDVRELSFEEQCKGSSKKGQGSAK